VLLEYVRYQMTPKKINSYLRIAKSVSEDSHDAQTKVGYVLVHGKTGAIIATGYNGFIRGADDENLPKTRPEKYPYMIHSETNLLCNAVRHGISTQDCYLVGTLSPCVNCLRLIYQSGITTIFFKEKYTDFEINCQMKDIEVQLTELAEFYRIDIKPRK
jgi:dCMP deaminase